MKTFRQLASGLAGGIVALGLSSVLAQPSAETPSNPSSIAPPSPPAVRTSPAAEVAPKPKAVGGGEVRLSRGLSDVVAMLQADVNKDVVKTYIENSHTAYNPSAAEIIALNERGVPPDLIVAMLKRGAELRAQPAPPAQVAQPAPAAPVVPPATAATPAPVYAAPSYDYAQPYTYAVQPVYSAAPYTYWYNYSYPAYPTYSFWWYTPWYWSGYHHGRYWPYRHFASYGGHRGFAYHRGPYYGGHRGFGYPSWNHSFRGNYFRGHQPAVQRANFSPRPTSFYGGIPRSGPSFQSRPVSFRSGGPGFHGRR